MAKILRKTDRLTVKIDDVTVKLAPLSIDQKVEIDTAKFNARSKDDVAEMTRAFILTVRYGLKGIEGVFDSDGNPYQLSFEGDTLTQECASDLMNLEINVKLFKVCSHMLRGIPSEFTDANGNPIEGVEIIKQIKEPDSKNV